MLKIYIKNVYFVSGIYNACEVLFKSLLSFLQEKPESIPLDSGFSLL